MDSLATAVLFAFPVALIGITANCAVMLAILGDRRMRSSPMYLLLANLAFGDFAFLLATLVWLVSSTQTSGFNAQTNALSSYLSTVALTNSIFTNVAVCMERYVTVAHPLHFKHYFNRCRILLYILFLWVVAFVFYLPHYVDPSTCPTVTGTSKGNANSNRSVVIINWNECYALLYHFAWWRTYKFFDCTLTYAAAITLLGIFYAKTCRILWSDSLPVYAISNSGGQLRSLIASRRAAVKMLIVCVCVFYACYTLATVSNAVKSITGDYNSIPEQVDFISINLLMFASSINPFVYSLFSITFRERMGTMLPRRTISRFSLYLNRSGRPRRGLPPRHHETLP